MSYDLECPYCEAALKINHDDGFGYETGVNHEMECNECGKHFIFTTEMSFDYTPHKADCLNGEDHKFEITTTVPKCFSKMRCSYCGEERDLTETELLEHKIGTIKEYFDTLKK